MRPKGYGIVSKSCRHSIYFLTHYILGIFVFSILLAFAYSWDLPFKTLPTPQVILAKDGSHLFISCNRLLGSPVSPECVTTTTTTTTTTSTTSAPYNLLRIGSHNILPGDVEVKDVRIWTETECKTPAQYGLQHNPPPTHPLPATHCLYIRYFGFGKGGGGSGGQPEWRLEGK